MSRLNLSYIAARRKELGLKQEDMATKLGMAGAPDYNKYENGVYKLKAEMLPLLSHVLDCPIEKFFCTSN